ncbi:Flagellar motility protein MotE, a chaperone for MotC folding [Paenibacillaceae bacterium GAS479]|nr:Flagellar motility protein MotE, a chaperone for MotC folding [Paenibacillaceae bacterium GAS479]
MAKEEMEKQGYSGMEKFLFFVTPLLFTVVLVMVLFVVFNPSLRERLVEAGQGIPVVGALLPEPTGNGQKAANTQGSELDRKQLASLQADLQAAQAKLAAAQDEKTGLETQIKTLQDQIDGLIKSGDAEKLSAEQYKSKIDELAGMFASMSASKAAPILQSMTLEESVLVLSSMDARAQGGILAKMDPKRAAQTAARMKDDEPVKDQQIAALQSRLQLEATATTGTSTILNQEQLTKTFESMNAAQAAPLLLQMADVSPSKVLRILGGVSDTTRSSIVAEMSGLNKDITSQLVSKLMAGK